MKNIVAKREQRATVARLRKELAALVAHSVGL